LVIVPRPPGIIGLIRKDEGWGLLVIKYIIVTLFDETQHVLSFKEVPGGTLEGWIFWTQEYLDHLLII
jgi:hypothetical protein